MIVYNNTPDTLTIGYGNTMIVCKSRESLTIEVPDGLITIESGNQSKSPFSSFKLIKYETLTTARYKALDICCYTEFATKINVNHKAKKIVINKNDYWMYNHIVFSLYQTDESVEQEYDFCKKSDKTKLMLFSAIKGTIYGLISSLLLISMLYWAITDFEWLCIPGLILGIWFFVSVIQYIIALHKILNFRKKGKAIIQSELRKIRINKVKPWFFKIERIETII
ncbi:MAG: hypothetical protein ACI4SB_08220 [Acutalibacteraceae bacterium]